MCVEGCCVVWMSSVCGGVLCGVEGWCVVVVCSVEGWCVVWRGGV